MLATKSPSLEEQLFAALTLNRIGLYYPEDDLGFAVFDYVINGQNGNNIVDHLLAIEIRIRDKKISTAMES